MWRLRYRRLSKVDRAVRTLWRRLGLSRPPHTDVWKFYRWLSHADGSRQALTAVEAEVAAICDLLSEVGSGGFDSYFRYSGGDTAEVALAALPKVLGEDWAEVLRDAMAQIGDPYPSDIDLREERLDAPGVGEALDALDHRLFELESTTWDDAAVTQYLRSGGQIPGSN